MRSPKGFTRTSAETEEAVNPSFATCSGAFAAAFARRIFERAVVPAIVILVQCVSSVIGHDVQCVFIVPSVVSLSSHSNDVVGKGLILDGPQCRSEQLVTGPGFSPRAALLRKKP